MSPFSRQIRTFRENRNLRQSEAAELLGYEQSYLCGLETGSKGTPNTEFVNQLIYRYELSEQEIENLWNSLKRSNRRYVIPLKASTEIYELYYLLNEQVNELTPTQINLIQIALNMRVNKEESHIN